MKDTEYAFGVAKIRANENRLLSTAVLESVITAQSYSDALKILSDSGFGNFNENNVDEVLSDRAEQMFSLVRECAPDVKSLDFLIVKNDFHNAKTVLKAHITGSDYESFLLSPHITDVKCIKDAVEKKQYDSVPEYMRDALKEAYQAITKTLDGQLADIILDRAALEAQILLAKQAHDEFSIGLANLMTALSDIKIIFRASSMLKPREFYEQSVANCDMLDKNELTEAALNGTNAIADYISAHGFEKIAESRKKSFAAFEKCIDDELIGYVRDAKYHSLGVSPLVAFSLACDNEIKNVRIVLSCKKNGFAEENIRERVRVTL